MDIRKKLPLWAGYYILTVPLAFLLRERHFCSALSISSHAPASYLSRGIWSFNIVPSHGGCVCEPQAPDLYAMPFPLQKIKGGRGGGHNRDHGRQRDYLYLAAQTPLPKEAVVLQPRPCTKEAPGASPLPSATSGWSSTFVSGPQRHLISILRDVLWFWRAPLPGEHYCSHVPWLFFVIATF